MRAECDRWGVDAILGEEGEYAAALPGPGGEEVGTEEDGGVAEGGVGVVTGGMGVEVDYY